MLAIFDRYAPLRRRSLLISVVAPFTILDSLQRHGAADVQGVRVEEQ